MKILKSVIRYKCDYCSRVNIQKPAMDRHERICYLNPNRECYISNEHWVKYIQPVLDEMNLVIGENTDFDHLRVPLSTDDSDWHKFIRLVNSKI